MPGPATDNSLAPSKPSTREPHSDFARSLIGAIQDGLVILRADGVIVEVNDAFSRMTGFDREELVDARPPHPFWPQDQWPLIRPDTHRALAGESWERDLVFATKQGRRIDVIVSAAPLDEPRGFSGCVMTVKDVTYRKRAEDALRAHAAEMTKLAQALNRSNEELDQFAYVTSHDLKAPLRGIANLSRWIEEDLGQSVTPDVARMMELLRGRVERMEKLIEGLLAYSRIGRTRDKLEPVDAGAVVCDAVDLLAIPEEFVVDVAPDLPVVVAQRVRLQQVFMNLIGNAVKHHHRKSGPGRVRVAWSGPRGGFYEFSVTDDGPGIEPRYHDRVFGIFQTLEARDKVEGAGIGLALVKKIVEGAGGTIRLDSEPGAGSRFVLTWPAHATPEGQAGA